MGSGRLGSMLKKVNTILIRTLLINSLLFWRGDKLEEAFQLEALRVHDEVDTFLSNINRIQIKSILTMLHTSHTYVGSMI